MFEMDSESATPGLSTLKILSGKNLLFVNAQMFALKTLHHIQVGIARVV